MTRYKRPNAEKIEDEITMLYDGLNGQLQKFNDYNRNNEKMYELVSNMLKISFKLGFNISKKVKFDKINIDDSI